MSFAFAIRQLDFPKRAILLQGRSLPYRGVSWGVEQRLDENWFPGNPQGVVQVIGPRELPTTITGMWKDVFLFDDQHAATLLNFPGLMPAARPDATTRGGTTFASGGATPKQKAQLARVLRDAFRMLIREGVKVKVEWGSLARVGFLKRGEFPHDREEDINYEIEFMWIGETDADPKPKKRKAELLSFLKQLLALLDQILNAVIGAVIKASLWIRRVNQVIAKLGSFVTELLGALDKLASFAFAPADTLANIRAQMRAITLAARELRQTIFDGASASYEATVQSLNPIEIAAAHAHELELLALGRRLGAEAEQMRLEIEEFIVPELEAIYVSPGGITLRDVSLRFYGTPDNWQAIADFNGFGTSVVSPGTVVRVPKL